MAHRTLLFILGLLHLNNSMGRQSPVLILNTATQCYFNAGLQSIFATKNFIPWIEQLNIQECVDKKNQALITSLQELAKTYESSSFIKWPSNEKLFEAIKTITKVKKSEQYDVLTVIEIILERLPKGCGNPIIMKGKLQIDKSAQSEISIIPLGFTLAYTEKITIADAFNIKFNGSKIEQKPIILCIEFEAENTNTTEIPHTIFINKNSTLNTEKGEEKYILRSIAWRVSTGGTASGHYFSTVNYGNTWYILDEAWRYGPEEYTADNPPQLETLKISQKKSKFTWMNQEVTQKKYNEWLKNGNFTININSETATVSPVLIVYERELTEQEKKESLSAPSQALSESLQKLQQNLTTLHSLINT